MRVLSYIVVLLCVLFPAHARGITGLSTPDELDKTLHEQLANIYNTADSVLVLENIYDLALMYRPSKADSIAEVTYRTARRADNYAASLDMLRQRANLNLANDSVMKLMRRRASTIPPSGDRDRTLAFIDIMLNSYNSRNLDEEARNEQFSSELRQYTLNPPESIYDRIVLLHSVCVNLSRETRGELLMKYSARLLEMIDSVADPNYVLHNVFYVQAAIDYSYAGLDAKAVETDRKLLQSIDSMEVMYARAGRPYRYYDSHRYIIYTRMLSNWKALTPEEIEDYYRKAIYISSKDSRARVAYKRLPRPDIYYSMATKDYETARRLLVENLDNPSSKPYRRHFLRYLLESCRALGDNVTALGAYEEYIALLEAELDRRVQERYKELQVLYEVQDMKRQYQNLSAEKQLAEYSAQRRTIYISLAFAGVLVVLVVILVWLNRRARRLARTLAHANEALRHERDNLRTSQAELMDARDRAEKASNFKSDFIKNLSREVAIPLKAISEYTHLIVDCTDSSGKSYLERYTDLIDQNCQLVNSIASDVLHLAEIDSASLSVQRRSVDLYRTVSAVVDTVSTRVPAGVTLALDEASPRIEINTDPRRLQQILLALTGNAVKFTREGSIVVSYEITPDRENVEISVTDTGIGIPSEQSERIFERFVKLDKDTQGVGLGLTIARLVARLLGGDVRLDTSYAGGARFVLTLPLRSVKSS